MEIAVPTDAENTAATDAENAVPTDAENAVPHLWRCCLMGTGVRHTA